MHALDDTARLYDLLREAGEEPVTLDELAVVGIRDPATALLDLELAGHAVLRVRDNRAECVRLAPFDGVHLLAEPERAPEQAALAAPEPSPEPVHVMLGPEPERETRPLLIAVALLVVALLLARR